MSKELKLVIDYDVLDRYNKYYFANHPRAKKQPIEKPWHESINKWMIMKRPMMNALKQKWKDFIVWFINDLGYNNMDIEKCSMEFCVYYDTNHRHDTDNTCPKFILDGLSESGFIVDDDSKHLRPLILDCDIDKERPRTEIKVTIYAKES